MDSALTHLSANDPILAKLIATLEQPIVTKHTDYYRELVESIIGQQLSVKAARAIRTRFVELFSGIFPSPEQILDTSLDELRAVGLSRPKAGYIQDLARHVLDGSVRFDNLDHMTDDEIITQLTSIKGVGVWTVHMFLIFCMGREDVLPTGDLGIRNGIQRLYKLEQLPDPDTIGALAEQQGWHPYASVASLYIWRSLDNEPK